LTILSTLPSAAIGAGLSLMATLIELTVIALIGLILLIGVEYRSHAEKHQNFANSRAYRNAPL
jgi:hypothetical protein